MLLKLEQEQQSKATIKNSQQRKKTTRKNSRLLQTISSLNYGTICFHLLRIAVHWYFFFFSTNYNFLSVLFHSSKELMNQPVSMPCGHSACKACLLEMISKQSIGSRPCICPLCEKFHWNKLLETFTLI